MRLAEGSNCPRGWPSPAQTLLTVATVLFTMSFSRAAKERVVVGFVPKEMFFTKGVGKHREKLTSFELALRSAGIAACNLVRVSSIFPPGCRILSRAQGAKRLEPGQVTFVVMSEAATREPHRLIAATVGVAIPRKSDLYGY